MLFQKNGGILIFFVNNKKNGSNFKSKNLKSFHIRVVMNEFLSLRVSLKFQNEVTNKVNYNTLYREV